MDTFRSEPQPAEKKPIRGLVRTISLRVILMHALFAVAILALVWIMFSQFGIYAYSRAAWGIAKTIAFTINGDEFAASADNAGEPTVFDAQVQTLLDNSRNHTNIQFAYTVHKLDNGDAKFHAVANRPSEKGMPVAEDAITPELAQTLATGDETRTKIYDPGKYAGDDSGEVISAFVPIRDSRERTVGAVGVGISASRLAKNASIFLHRLLSLAIPLTLLIAASIVYFSRKHLSKPLRLLTEAATNLANGQLTMPALPKRHDEIGILSDSIASVARSVETLTKGVDGFAPDGKPAAAVHSEDLNGKYRMVAQGIKKAITIMDNINQMVCVIDIKTHEILYVNKWMAATFGMDTESIAGKKCWEVFCRNPHEPCSFCPIPRMLTMPDGLQTTDWEGHEERLGIWFSARSSIVPWIDGQLAHFFTAADITLNKSYAEKQKLHEEQLREAADAAREASRMKTAFIANMSHEIRTPMNGIIGFTELAAADSGLPAKTKGYLRKIKLSAESLLHILNDILDISRVETGKLALENIPFSLHDVFETCRELSSSMAKQKGLDLYFYAEPYVGKRLVGDPNKLQQILSNLLSNAIKFTNRGIVKLSAVVERSDADTATIYFEVKDSGIGMTPEQVRTVFEPFVQADYGINRRYGGTGLGLSITSNLIRLLGGKLEVESARGLGSNFHFRLTFTTVDKPGEVKSAPEWKSKAPRFEGSVLVCEDNFINQEVILENLARLGLKADIASDGQVGIEMAETARRDGKPYDLILMDVHMPVMDGLEATERLRALGNPSPIIAVTANIMHKDRETYFKLGMVDCLGKPFRAVDLWSVLRRYLTEVEVDGTAGTGTPEDAPPEPAENAAPDEPRTLDRDLGLKRAAGNAQLYAKLLQNFATDHHRDAMELMEQLRIGDYIQAHSLAHTMKGAAGMIGATALANAAKALEAHLTDTPHEANDDLLQTFENELSAVLGEISHDEKDGEEKMPPTCDDSVVEILDSLEPLLKAGDPACLDILRDKRGALAGCGTLGKELTRSIESYDFEPALATLAKLRERLGNKK